ncbi:MAG: antitoxin HicB [Lachnospiraceae bacterium]|nr:antitoxin HicB [Lachnospiraceae bacterium]
MTNTIEYKGCIGSIEFSENDGVYYGKVQGIRSLISYEGKDIEELISDFHGAVDEYLDLCAEEGEEPETSTY